MVPARMRLLPGSKLNLQYTYRHNHEHIQRHTYVHTYRRQSMAGWGPRAYAVLTHTHTYIYTYMECRHEDMLEMYAEAYAEGGCSSGKRTSGE